MPRLRAIILEKDDRAFKYVLWADVPVARQPFYADASKVSRWKDALAADNVALQTGAVAEKEGAIVMLPGDTLVEARAEIVKLANGFQAHITAYNPWLRYGATWDGAIWVAGGVS